MSDLTYNEAMRLVHASSISDVSMFHSLGDMGDDSSGIDFSLSYPLQVLLSRKPYSKEEILCLYQPLIDYIRIAVAKIEKPRVLDYRCGEGNLSKFFREEGYDVVSVDNSTLQAAIAFEFNKIQVRLIRESIDDTLKIEEGCFDVIFGHRVFEEPVMTPYEVTSTLRLLLGYLNKGGQYVISTATGVIPLREIASLGILEEIDTEPSAYVRRMVSLRQNSI